VQRRDARGTEKIARQVWLLQGRGAALGFVGAQFIARSALIEALKKSPDKSGSYKGGVPLVPII
jgi:hypothetical protein